MDFELLPLEQADIDTFKHDIQEAFQKGYEDVYGKTERIILPEKDIDSSMNAVGSVSYKAVVGGEIVGGAVVVIDEKTNYYFEYLDACADNGLDVFLIEYGASDNLTAEITAYCKKNEFACYFAKSLALD